MGSVVEDFRFRALNSEDWAAGGMDRTSNLVFEDGLRLKKIEVAGRYETDGIFKSHPLDSGLQACLWHRVVMDADIPDNCAITMRIWTSSDAVEYRLFEKTLSFKEHKDALIRAEPGRYIQLEICLHGDGDNTPVLRQVRLYYPRQSYLRYLPAVYQEEDSSRDFIERFLSIFESTLYDSEELISGLPSYFDPKAAPDRFLPWLAGWMALDLYPLLGEKNREFILRVFEFYRLKGTAGGLADLVSFLTERKCCIKEYMNNVFRSYGREHDEAVKSKDEMGCTGFYHNTSRSVDTDPNSGMVSRMGGYYDEVHYTYDSRDSGRYSPRTIGIFIFLNPGDTLPMNEEDLKKIIDAFIPAFIRVDLITVESFDEDFSLKRIGDWYADSVRDRSEEHLRAVEGSYTDAASFHWLCTHTKGRAEGGWTNNPDYRTPHTHLRLAHSL